MNLSNVGQSGADKAHPKRAVWKYSTRRTAGISVHIFAGGWKGFQINEHRIESACDGTQYTNWLTICSYSMRFDQRFYSGEDLNSILVPIKIN